MGIRMTAALAGVLATAGGVVGVFTHEPWAGLQTGTLIGTAAIVLLYTAETRRLRSATESSLEVTHAQLADSRRGGRAMVGLELLALKVQLTHWIDPQPTGREHGLYVWLCQFRSSHSELSTHLRRAEAHLQAATRLAAFLSASEIAALGRISERYYAGLNELESMTPKHRFWAIAKDLGSDSTVNQAEYALRECRKVLNDLVGAL